MTRALVLSYGAICYAIFFATFVYMIGFLSGYVVPKTIDSGPAIATAPAILINLVLIALFGIQHTVMARPGFKRRWNQLVPPSAERSTYVLLGSLLLVLLMWQWRPMPQVIWQVGTPWSYLIWALCAFGWVLVLASTFAINHFHLFGLQQVWQRFRERPLTSPEYKEWWMYKVVRHPLMLGFIIAFWATPMMTVGHLLFAMGMTVYILIALRYEERDLLREHGEQYRQYQNRVPMLVPGMAAGKDNNSRS